jgi:stage II sporulation protein D
MPRPGWKQGPLPALGAALFFGLAGCAAPILRETPTGTRWERPSIERAEGEDGPPLRVLLKFGSHGLRASAPGGLRLCAWSGAGLCEIPADGKARLSVKDGRLYMNGGELAGGAALIQPLLPDEAVRVGGRRYRGRLLIEALGNRLALLNVVGLEDYLRGVLPSEVEAGGPAEALKAQAVAARSFALAEMRESASKAWDLDNSSDSQVYGSREAETAATDGAVRSTRGEVLAWHGGVAHAFFDGNSGGYTADEAEVWGGEASPEYLQGVPDPWSEHQRHSTWTATVPCAEAEVLLHKAGLWTGLLAAVVPRDRSRSGRWARIELVDGQGRTATVSANAFRRAFGADRVRSTRFDVRVQDDALVFDGRGWGHGVGMSQEGAFAMAKSGWDYRAILYFYYPGTYLALLRE